MRGGLQGERAGRASWREARIAEVDADLVRLGRGGAGLRLWLGEVLERLAVLQGHHKLGFSSVGAYVAERCGLRERWVADTRAMARRLAELPGLRRALVRGEVSWSMAATLVPHVTRDSEAFLMGLAKRATVRQVRALFQDEKGDGGGEDLYKRYRIRRTVDREVAVLFEGMRQRVRMQVGTRASDAVWEALLAEGMTSLGEHVGEVPDPPQPDVRDRPRSEPDPPAWVPPRLPPLRAVRPRAMGRVTLDLWMSAELAALYRALEGAWDRAGRPCGDFLGFLSVAFYRAWEHTYEFDVAYADIYARDGGHD
jgi:hypothetical protein